MKLKIVALTIGTLLLRLGSAPTLAQAPPLFSPENGHYYELVLVDPPVRWEEARDLASQRSFKGLQGHLATITSAAENDFVCNVGAARYWLGGFQDTSAPDFAEPDSGWRWITGEPWDFSNWHAKEPNNLPLPGTTGDEDYLTLFAAYKWNDLQRRSFRRWQWPFL